MKFINDGHDDPCDRLQLMLELTSTLLPGTNVYMLYDHIPPTCVDSGRAQLHLLWLRLRTLFRSLKFRDFLDRIEGKDVEGVLVQLRSKDILADRSLSVNIFHASVRDYVLKPQLV